jgi:kelch-like protein 20
VLNGKNKRKIFINWIVEFRFDPQTNQWSNDIAPTSSCRTSVGVAVLDGCLFAVGGQDGISCLNLVEK